MSYRELAAELVVEIIGTLRLGDSEIGIDDLEAATALAQRYLEKANDQGYNDGLDDR